MPAKKSIAVHKMQGTYQPCRHANREEKVSARVKQKRSVPAWLPDEVKMIYRKLMACLPPLDAIEETALIQLAMLKHKLETGSSLPASDHSQLRHLVAMVRGWAKDYRDSQQPEEKDAFQQWMDAARTTNNDPPKTEGIPDPMNCPTIRSK